MSIDLHGTIFSASLMISICIDLFFSILLLRDSTAISASCAYMTFEFSASLASFRFLSGDLSRLFDSFSSLSFSLARFGSTVLGGDWFREETLLYTSELFAVKLESVEVFSFTIFL